MSTSTAHHHWDKPDVSGSANTWGSILNGTTDKIDQAVYDVEQGAPPVGAIIMFAGATAPPNWLLCNGAQIDTTVYAKLFAVIKNAFGGVGSAGNFLLPNLVDRFPIGAGTNALGVQQGSNAVTIGVANLPAHNHPASQAAHTHPGSYQDVHAHVITTGGHAHAIHTGSHNHTVGGATIAGSGLTNGGVNLQIGSQTTSTAGDLGGNTDTAGNLGGQTDNRQPAVHIDTQQPAVSVGNTGSGTPLTIQPPFSAVNYIIRYQ